MDYYGIDKSCFIGETRYSAGIFLSEKSARSKPYGETLSLETFENFSEAYKAFWQKYEGVIEKETFRLNRLLQVRDKNEFTVFSTPYIVEVCYSRDYLQEIERRVVSGQGYIWSRHNLEYAEAVRIARERFVKYWKDSMLYVEFNIHPYQPIYLNEVKRYIQSDLKVNI